MAELDTSMDGLESPNLTISENGPNLTFADPTASEELLSNDVDPRTLVDSTAHEEFKSGLVFASEVGGVSADQIKTIKGKNINDAKSVTESTKAPDAAVSADDIEKGIQETVKIAEMVFANMKNPHVKKMEPLPRLQLFHKKYDEFAKRFPVVLKYMVLENNFHSKAFAMYLRNINKRMSERSDGKSAGMDGFIKSQADYIKYLYMFKGHPKTGKKYSGKELCEIWEMACKSLKEEADAFQKEIEKRKKEMEEKVTVKDAERKTEAKTEWLKRLKDPNTSKEDKIELLRMLQRAKEAQKTKADPTSDERLSHIPEQYRKHALL